MSADIQRLKQLLAEALALPAADRKAFVELSCAGDAELRAELERLIAAHEGAGDFLEQSAVPPEPDLRIETSGSYVGRYKLLQEIGEGGFGRVFMAEQTEPVHRRVALKIVKAGMDTKEVIARFEAERQALALMEHPNIARVLDGGTTEAGRPYFVMELVKGIPITEYCDRNNLPMAERLQLFMQVCQAVQHAHQKAIIHRDLKPTNILVTMIDGKPVPKIIDFGVAKALGHKLTEKTLFTAFEQVIGTPAYMSPEQAALSGVDVDTRSDIYSLGVLLYELLTGVTPFDGEMLRKVALDEIRRMIRETEPQKPSTRLQALVAADVRKLKKTGDRQLTEEEVRASSRRLLQVKETIRLVQGDLDWIVMKALEKDRARRYETAGALAEDLQRHLEHHPVRASPPSALYRAHKFICRHRVGAGLSATAVAALLVGLSAAVVGFVKARQERMRAVLAEQQALQERNHAELLAAEAALDKGQTKLETSDSWGLLDLLEAYTLAEHNPEFQKTVGRRWSTWHAYWARQTIAVRPMFGTPSPDHLQFVSLFDWPTYNTSNDVHLYDSLSGAQVAGPMMHASAAVGCAFSPDGRLLATVTDKGVIHLWECGTGKPFRPPCETGVERLNQLSFSPCGRYLVAFSGFGVGWCSTKVAVVRLADAQEPLHLLDHRYPAIDARFSPDGGLLAVICKPDLQLWRTSDLTPIGPPLKVSMSAFVEFSADGAKIAFNPSGATGIGLLDTRTMQVVRVLPKKRPSAMTVGFSHDGRLLASFDWDCTLELWKTESGGGPYAARRIGVRMNGPFAFNRDDSLLAFGDVVGTVRIFRTSDGQIVHTLHTHPWPHPVFLTNGVLASTLGSWDLTVPPLPGNPLFGDALAHTLEFDRSGKFLAVGSEGELRLWMMQPSLRLERVVPLPGRVVALTFSDAESEFVAFSDDGSLTWVEPRTGRTTTAGNFGRGSGLAASISPDGRKLALFRYSEVLVVNTRAGSFQWLEPSGGVESVAFRPDSQRLAQGTAGWKVKLYDTSAKTNVSIGTPKQFEGWVQGVAYHPDGNLLAVCVMGNTLHLYDPRRDRDMGMVRKTSVKANLVRFSPDGSLLAVAGPLRDGGHAVEIWHVDAQRGLFASGVCLLRGQPVWSVAFSPDNRTLIVGGLGSTRLWHLPPQPTGLEEVQSQTWTTLGFRMDEEGNQVYLDPPTNGVEKIRARLTQEPVSPDTPLDTALKLPAGEALTALQQLAEQHPGATAYQKLLGRLHADLMVTNAQQGSWTEALAHADDAIRLGYDDPYIRYQRALLCLGAGDVKGYRITCRAMVERYKSSADPAVIERVGWSAALAPRALDDYSDVIKRLRRAAPKVGGTHGPAYRFYLGAVLARAGQYTEAVAELENVDRHLHTAGTDVEFYAVYYYKFLLAICQARLGHEDSARHWFDAATLDARNLLHPDQEHAPAINAIPWNRRLTLELLRNETASMLTSTSQESAMR